MNLNLLYLISVLSDFLVLIYVLDLELTLDIKLECLDKVLICVLGRLLIVIVTLKLLRQSALVLHQLVLDLVLDVIEIQRRHIWVRVLSNLNLNFFLRTKLNDKLDYGLRGLLRHHVLDVALHTLNVDTCLGN